MTKLVARNYRAEDEYGIVNLYNRITGRNRSIDQHRWEWLETPEGRGSIWVITEFDSRQIVGHHGLIPIKLNIFGKSFLMGKTENTILDPKYAGTGIYFIFEKRFVEESKERFDLLCTTSGRGTPGRIRKKLGYKIVGRYSNYMKITEKEDIKIFFDSLILKQLSNKALRLMYKNIAFILYFILRRFFLIQHKPDNDMILTPIENIDTIKSWIDNFWKHNKAKFGITIDRNFKYLKWRIFKNPNEKYSFFLANKKSKIVGYVITKISTRDTKRGIIVDLVCENNNDHTFSSILAAAIDRFREMTVPIVIFPTLSSKNILNKTLIKNGFFPIERLIKLAKKILKTSSNTEISVLLLKPLNREIDSTTILNAYNWYYTDLFTEGIS